MIGVVLALLAAVAYGLSVVFVRQNLDESNVLNSIFAVTFTGNLILWPLALLFSDLRTVKIEGLLLFAIAGTLAPGVGRLLYYKGMKILGPSVNASIVATYPLYSSIIAAGLLNEKLSAANWFGIMCVLAGVVFIQRNWSGSKTKRDRILRNFAFPVIATLFIALSQIVRKYGLSVYNEPLLGLAAGYGCSLLVYAFLLTRTRASQRVFSLRKELQLFWKAGVGLCIGWLLAFFALSYERVSVVTPLLQTESLFVIFFSYILLRKLEHISVGLVVGALTIVFGVTLVGMR